MSTTLKRGTPIDPGRLDKDLQIQEVMERVPDGAGGYVNVWGAVPNGSRVWGALEPLRGEERLRAMQQRSNATHQVTIRWLANVTAQCRVIWHDPAVSDLGRTFNIVEPPRGVPDTRETHLVFTVREEPIE